MSGFCNLGENELPRATQDVRELDISHMETFSDLNLAYANWEADVKWNVVNNPVLVQKVDTLCDLYNAEELAFKAKELGWQILSTKRQCHTALSEGERDGLVEHVDTLKQLTLQKAVICEAERRAKEAAHE